MQFLCLWPIYHEDKQADKLALKGPLKATANRFFYTPYRAGKRPSLLQLDFVHSWPARCRGLNRLLLRTESTQHRTSSKSSTLNFSVYDMQALLASHVLNVPSHAPRGV